MHQRVDEQLGLKAMCKEMYEFIKNEGLGTVMLFSMLAAALILSLAL